MFIAHQCIKMQLDKQMWLGRWLIKMGSIKPHRFTVWHNSLSLFYQLEFDNATFDEHLLHQMCQHTTAMTFDVRQLFYIGLNSLHFGCKRVGLAVSRDETVIDRIYSESISFSSITDVVMADVPKIKTMWNKPRCKRYMLTRFGWSCIGLAWRIHSVGEDFEKHFSLTKSTCGQHLDCDGGYVRWPSFAFEKYVKLVVYQIRSSFFETYCSCLNPQLISDEMFTYWESVSRGEPEERMAMIKFGELLCLCSEIKMALFTMPLRTFGSNFKELTARLMNDVQIIVEERLEERFDVSDLLNGGDDDAFKKTLIKDFNTIQQQLLALQPHEMENGTMFNVVSTPTLVNWLERSAKWITIAKSYPVTCYQGHGHRTITFCDLNVFQLADAFVLCDNLFSHIYSSENVQMFCRVSTMDKTLKMWFDTLYEPPSMDMDDMTLTLVKTPPVQLKAQWQVGKMLHDVKLKNIPLGREFTAFAFLTLCVSGRDLLEDQANVPTMIHIHRLGYALMLASHMRVCFLSEHLWSDSDTDCELEISETVTAFFNAICKVDNFEWDEPTHEGIDVSLYLGSTTCYALLKRHVDVLTLEREIVSFKLDNWKNDDYSLVQMPDDEEDLIDFETVYKKWRMAVSKINHNNFYYKPETWLNALSKYSNVFDLEPYISDTLPASVRQEVYGKVDRYTRENNNPRRVMMEVRSTLGRLHRSYAVNTLPKFLRHQWEYGTYLMNLAHAIKNQTIYHVSMVPARKLETYMLERQQVEPMSFVVGFGAAQMKQFNVTNNEYDTDASALYAIGYYLCLCSHMRFTALTVSLWDMVLSGGRNTPCPQGFCLLRDMLRLTVMRLNRNYLVLNELAETDEDIEEMDFTNMALFMNGEIMTYTPCLLDSDRQWAVGTHTKYHIDMISEDTELNWETVLDYLHNTSTKLMYRLRPSSSFIPFKLPQYENRFEMSDMFCRFENLSTEMSMIRSVLPFDKWTKLVRMRSMNGENDPLGQITGSAWSMIYDRAITLDNFLCRFDAL